MAHADVSADEKLASFQSVTGVSDTEFSKSVLDAHSWNVEAAVTAFLSVNNDFGDYGDEAPLVPDRRNQAGSSSRAANAHNAAGAIIRPYYSRGILGVPEAILRTGFGLVSGALLLSWRVAGLALSLLPAGLQALGGGTDNQTSATRSFLHEYEATYGSQHPAFVDMPYTDALKLARDSHRFLCVYLHARDHVNTPDFCRRVLSSQAVIDFLNSQFLVWAGDVRHSDAFQLANILRTATFPYVAVLMSRGGTAALVTSLEGPVSVDEFISTLTHAVNEHGAALTAARLDAEERDLNRRLREEQDAAYHASLEVDRARERERLEAEARVRAEVEAQAAAEARAKAEVEAAQEQGRLREQAREERRRKALASLPPEPEKGTAGTSELLIRLPDGQRVSRRFPASATVQTVYDFVDSLDFVKVDDYSLATNFPRKVYGPETRAQTLQHSGLHPQAMLFLQENS
eukprot:jgi/Chlat1/7829/Chrsp66S07281